MSQLKQDERAFQTAVIDLARACRWRVAHFHDSRRAVHNRNTGQTTLVGDKDATGFPDLVLVRAPFELIFAELKSDTGRTRPEQAAWLGDLSAVASLIADLHAHGRMPGKPTVNVYLWTPDQWPEIERRLRLRVQ